MKRTSAGGPAAKRVLSILLVLLALWAFVRLSDSGERDASEPVPGTSSGVSSSAETEDAAPAQTEDSVRTFRSERHLQQHYEKHGIEMGFDSAADYEAAASAVVNNPSALHKTEAEDGDDVYLLEETGEFVVVSTDGYIRTYFIPGNPRAYFDRQ